MTVTNESGDTILEVAATESSPNRADTNEIDPLRLSPTPWQQFVGHFLIDSMVALVVLNLAAELVDSIVIDHFSISIFVALVLTLVLNTIQHLEHKAQHYFCAIRNRRFLGALIMWLIVFLSKFVILWIDDVIFGHHVSLGKFWSILILSFTLMVSEKLVWMLYITLGEWERSRMGEKSTQERSDVGRLVAANDCELPVIGEKRS